VQAVPPSGGELASHSDPHSTARQTSEASSRGNLMAKTRFRPLHDRVVVKRIDAEEKTKAASSFPTAPRKSRRRAKWWQWAPAGATRPAS
jgi:hypothetical protein